MKSYFIAIIAILALNACEKAKVVTNPASVLIVQANPDLNSVVPVFGNNRPQYFSSAVSVGYGSGYLYNLSAAEKQLTFYQSTDTIKPYFGISLNLEPVGIYSYFLAGNGSKPDTLLIKEQLSNYTDGSAGVRILNLSPDCPAVSVNLDTDPGQAEFSNLSYKQYSAFKNYQQSVDGYYNFEIHDQNTGDLLSTYSWFYTPGKNNTIVIAGSVDPASPTPLTIFQVNHF